VDHGAALADVVNQILEHEVVLVRGPDRAMQGIVTSHDVAIQFQGLAEPFLLVGEIEDQLRRMIDGRFTLAQLTAARHNDDARAISTVADLNLGEVVRLIEEPNNWARFGLQIDRAEFVRVLGRVRDIRNDLMHFDPDGVSPGDVDELRRTARFVAQLSPAPAA
jgi:hypothetical protein